MSPRRSTPCKVKKSSPKNRVKKKLARWSDGLFYIIKILKVSEMTKRCLVEFEDMSTAYVHFKDLLEENQDEAKTCHNCGGQEEFEDNTFVECTNCEREYHRYCHVPPITSKYVDKDFICRICVFAACAKLGGARDVGSMAARFLFMKQEFPYDLEHLSWNPSHTHNVSECYCYCGGPGSWYNKMLQCCRCQQWFHEACVQCIDCELFIGDRFYVFACAHCNQGEEFISRVDMDWLDIVYVAIFHLSMAQGLKYTNIDAHIVPFLKQKANSFGLQRLLNGKHLDKKAIRQEVVHVVTSLKDIFCCGSEVKKKCSLFGLRERIPPAPPSVYIPFPGEKITAASLNNPLGRKVLFKPAKYSMPVPYLIKGANKFIPSSMKVREAKVARLKNEHNYCSFSHESRNSSSSDSSSESFDANNNSSPTKASLSEDGEESSDDDMMDVDDVDGSISFNDSVLRACPTNPATKSSADGTQSEQAESDRSYWSLDTAFPVPVNFCGLNNPFLTEFEQEDLRMQRQHFISQLDKLAEAVGNDFTAQSKSPFAVLPLSAVSSPPLKDLKGFKGELAKLINKSSTVGDGLNTLKRRVNQNWTNLEKSQATPTSSPSSVPPNRRNLRQSTSASSSPLSNARTPSPSPKSRRRHLNGLSHIKREPRDDEEESEKKKFKNLSRCLKNLTPTCGFRFPVLDEKHPSLNGTNGQEENDQPPTPSLSTHASRKGQKRKHSSTVLTPKVNSSQDSRENVRRSHRNRQVVKRFEMVPEDSGQESLSKDCHVTSSSIGAAKYSVLSLRVRHDNSVDYLVDWCS